MGNFGTQIAKSAGWLGGAAPAAAAAVPKGIGGLGGAAGGAGGQVAAGLGHGAHVAGLSVPNSWPGATLASTAKPMSAIPVSEPITSGESGAGNLVGGMPVAEPVLRAGPARARATDSNPPSWPAPCPRASPPHSPQYPRANQTHPEGAPAAHPRPARLRASASKLIRPVRPPPGERQNGLLLRPDFYPGSRSSPLQLGPATAQ